MISGEIDVGLPTGKHSELEFESLQKHEPTYDFSFPSKHD